MSDLVIKHNQVIKASYRLTPNEQAIILSALSKLSKEDKLTDQHPYNINIIELALLTGISREKAYQTFKNACFELQDRKITISNKSNKRINWLQMVEYRDGEGLIRIQFSNPILPYLTNLKDNFTTYNLKDVARFKSTYGIRIYELIKQWEGTKSWLEISIQEMKSLFSIEDKYKRTDVFKRKVIEPAMKDINTYSDLQITYENIKTGRKITGFKFKFKSSGTKITDAFIKKNARPGESWEGAKKRLYYKDRYL